MSRRFDIVVIGGGASAEAFLRGMPPDERRTIALIAPGTANSAQNHTEAARALGAKASPKMRNRDLQRSAAEWRDHFPGVLHSDSSFFYSGFAHGGGTRFWGNSVGTFDAADLVAAGLDPSAIAAANWQLSRHVPVAGNVDDVLSDRYRDFPSSDFPYRSQRVAAMDGHYAAGNFLVGASRNAMTPGVPLGNCTGCAGCINGCAYGALWQSQIASLITRRHDTLAINGWARSIRDVKGGYQIDIALPNGSSDQIAAEKVCLAVDPVAAFALLAPLAGETADAELFNAPAIAWIAGSPHREVAAPGFGLAHSQVHIVDGARTLAFGHIFEGAPMTRATTAVLSDNGLIDQLFRLALPNLVLGNLFFRSTAAGAHLRYRDGGVTIESAGARVLPELKRVLRDLRAFCRANGLMLLTHRLSQPGSDLHYAGGVPKELKAGRAHATQLPGLYVVGGAAFNILPPQSPTFPYMAAAFALAQQWD